MILDKFTLLLMAQYGKDLVTLVGKQSFRQIKDNLAIWSHW